MPQAEHYTGEPYGDHEDEILVDDGTGQFYRLPADLPCPVHGDHQMEYYSRAGSWVFYWCGYEGCAEEKRINLTDYPQIEAP